LRGLCAGRGERHHHEFQFGTNWPGFMETVGNVAGPLLAYEVTAFSWKPPC
jgi:cytochrome bd-type quinol oxidase subunit 1